MSKQSELKQCLIIYDQLSTRIDALMELEPFSYEDRMLVDLLDDELDALTERIVELEDTDEQREVGQWWIIPIRRLEN